jgi:nicotinate-nucleotide adenylyltransferase
MQIALFGTSADPPTPGHQEIVKWLSQRFDRVAVWAADNPFKSHQTPLTHRSTMLQLAIDDLMLPQHNVLLYPELSHPRAISTLENAKKIWTQGQFTFVIGSDLIAQLPEWYRVEELLRQVKLLVVPRPGHPLRELALAELHRRGARVAIADLAAPDISSTTYRRTGATAGLAPPIEDYIHREHLYECQDDSRKKQPIH